VFVIVTVLLELLPTCTLPKLTLVGFAPSVPGVVPVPDSEMSTVVVEPVVESAMLPLTAVEDCGANVTLKLALCPAVRVRGVASPLILKPAPVTAACDTVRLVVPLFVMVSDVVLLPPIKTVPKLRLVGLAVRVDAARAAPDSAMLGAVPDAVEVNVTVPDELPAAVGVKTMLKLVLPLAANESGRVSPVTLKPVPVTVT